VVGGEVLTAPGGQSGAGNMGGLIQAVRWWQQAQVQLPSVREQKVGKQVALLL